MSESEFEAEQEKEAAAEAGAIGGRASSEPLSEYERELSEAERPVIEAGEGESEGFELSEIALEEHASHGDEHSAVRILEDAALYDEDEPESEQGFVAEPGEADEERPPDA
jgi:hypothetical protein